MRVWWISAAAVLAGCLEMNEDFMGPMPTAEPPTDGPTTDEPPTSDPSPTDESTDETTDEPGTEESGSDTEEPAGFCGDAIQQLGEDCDDGNDSDLDQCNGACQVTLCGDGITQPEFEECDDANLSDLDDCSNLCTFTFCGDGATQTAAGEECDDGNDFDDDACLISCMVATCGDGATWADHEECDDANAVETDACLSTCEENVCGDGIVEEGVEPCDDGDAEDLDGCDVGCVPSNVMYIFVTSTLYKGDLNGWMGADMECMTRAMAAKLPPATYRAWLSDANIKVLDRFNGANVPYIRPDGVRVADNFSQLLSGLLKAPVAVDENGDPGPMTSPYCGGGIVFTGTTFDGAWFQGPFDCMGWHEDMMGSALVGKFTAVDKSWTQACSDESPNSCTFDAAIYCVQDPP